MLWLLFSEFFADDLYLVSLEHVIDASVFATGPSSVNDFLSTCSVPTMSVLAVIFVHTILIQSILQ